MPEATAAAPETTQAAPVSAISAAPAPAPTPEETLATQREFLIANTPDGEKGLEGKSPEQIAALHVALVKKLEDDKAAAAAAAKPPTLDEQKKFLTDKGVKPEDLAKLDEKGVKAKFDELKAAEGKPTEYKDFQFPEGVRPDEKMLGEFKGIMAKAKVPQEEAQALINLYGKQLQELAKAPYDQWRTLQTKWQGEMLNDAEIGGSKEALDENLSFVSKMINVIGGKEAAQIRQVFDMTGAGNNPIMARFLVRVGKLLAEGAPTPPGGPALPNTKNPAEVLYPKQAESQLGNA